MARPHHFGRVCEDIAARVLTDSGWHILARNFRDGPREIDIIAHRESVVAFVEVKGRADAEHGHPLEAIGFRKRRELATAARAWIARHGSSRALYRFDAISVVRGESGPWRVEHIEDAWRL
jgi:putative endonuclease